MRIHTVAAVWAFPVICLVIVLLDLADGNIFYGDVDDRLRALQIADLLADGQWFDRTLPFIAMPEPYVSPWSRLVDLPYAGISLLLTPILGGENALQIASHAVPPLLAFAFAYLALLVMRSLTETAPAIAQLAVVALTMTYALWAFAPGRVDHHNMQLLAMMAMLAGFCMRGNAWLGGAVAGVAITLSVAIGLECLPLIAVAVATIAAFALSGEDRARTLAASCGATLVIAAPLAGLALVGPQVMLATRCDAWSAPWVAALFGGGIVLCGIGMPAISRMSVARRLGFAGLAAIALAMSLAAAFPACLQGPYAAIGEAAQGFWLDRVPQENSAAFLIERLRFGELATLAICAFMLAATARKARRDLRAGEHGFVLVWLISIAALALAIMQIRFIRFAPAFAPLLLPWLMAGLSAKPPLISRAHLAVAIALPAVALALAFTALQQRAHKPDAVDLMAADDCPEADFSQLAAVDPGRIIAPLGVSMPIAEAIVRDGLAHTITALPFHRASPGIVRVATAFTSNEPEARKQALAPFDMVAVCARETHIDLTGAPLYAALVSGNGWPGLEPVGALPDTGLHLYRIDHAALR